MSTRFTGGVISATAPAVSLSAASGVWTVKEAEYYQNSNSWPLGSGLDPYFKNVSMLLNGDGTNGAQNNTFVDSSTNNFSITRNGNTTQGSFSPYVGAGCWSTFFNGSSGMQYNATGRITVSSTATFTIESWVYLTATPSSTGPILADGQPNTATTYWSFEINSSRNLQFFWYISGNVFCTSTGTVPLNTWTHVAVSVSSGAIKLFINGVLQSTTGTSTLGSPGSTSYLQSGCKGSPVNYLTAYVSNLRISNTALYSVTFTPSTTPLTATANTTLLTSNSNAFADKSSTGNTLVPFSTPAVSKYSAFSSLVTYSSTYGGSGYFDGTGDYLTNTTANLTATSSFTLEYWIYNTSAVTGSPASFSIGNEATGRINFFITSSAIQYNVYGGSNTTIGSFTFYPNTWYHIAIVRSGTTLAAYVNGTSAGSVTLSGTLGNSTGFYINGNSGGANTTNPFYVSNMRYVNGTAVYTGNFTPPTTPVTAITNTQLLLNSTNAGIVNYAATAELETVGTAQISTSVVKYGTGSMYFSGTGSYLTAPNSPLWAFNTGDWTIECWVYLTSIAALQYLIDTRASAISASGLAINISTAGLPVITVNNTSLFTSSTAISTNTWTHLALVKNNGTITLYLNGTKPTTGSAASATSLTDQYMTIGTSIANRDTTAVNHMYGYIDDLRITNGYARYTANFTPPGGAYPTF